MEHIHKNKTLDCGVMAKFVQESQAKFVQDCGVMAKFVQESQASGSDTNISLSHIEYCGSIQKIIKVGLRQFHMFIFDVQWFKVIL